MAAPQNFRSAFNGFNREDVVRYLEYINAKHQEQVNELNAEAEQLRQQLSHLQALPLRDPEAEEAAAPADSSDALDAYRRADRIERNARERAELVYHQASAVLSEAIARVDATTAEITAKADDAMSQLTQLQMAVSASKQALQDASSLMNTIRPNF